MTSMKRLAAVSTQGNKKSDPVVARKAERARVDAHFKSVGAAPAKKKPAPTPAQARTQKAAALRDSVMKKVPVARHWYSSLIDALSTKKKE